jgi:uncharacterized caspase-like protein
MKRIKLIFALLIIILAGCVTPSRLGMNYRGDKIYSSTSNPEDNKNININVSPLTKEDIPIDIKGLKSRIIPYISNNEVLSDLMQKYPGLKIDIEIIPSEKINRTWILDALIIFDGIWPVMPWWGTINLNATMKVTLPKAKSNEFNFKISLPFRISIYPYYRAGKFFTEKYSIAYGNLFDQIESYPFSEIAEHPVSSANEAGGRTGKYIFRRNSEVDKDIPAAGVIFQNRFALIIGNEDYASQQIELAAETNVDFARNDASAFKEYAKLLLGIPEENIEFQLDATAGKMKQSLDKMRLLAKNSNGNAELFFYYAGHGLPDEIKREPYLIPVDISGANITDGIKLSDAYRALTEYPSKRVTVFLDACFSGGARNQGLITARSVRIKPADDKLTGNLIVFSASTGDQSSLGYPLKEHGIFTYYLLQKLKDSKADISYRELSEYLSRQVGLNSVLVNDKEQNPQTNVCQDVGDLWQTWRFR